MTHINDINNELPTQEIKLEIDWFIDRTPDLNIINNINRNDINDNDINDNDIILFNNINLNNIQNIRNNHFDQQFALANQALINGTINFQPNEDEFIPFQHEPLLNPVIETEVREIQVSEEERDCPICYEIKEREEISQLNCQHKFCTNCITEHIHRNRSETRCPFCRENITHITFQNDINEEHF